MTKNCIECPYPHFITVSPPSTPGMPPKHIFCSQCEAGKGVSLNRTSCELCLGADYSRNGLCDTCEAGKVPNSLHTACDVCPAGKGTSLNGTSCETCHGADYSAEGLCVACEDGKIPNSVHTACEECPLGRTGKRGRCNECVAGYFALAAHHPCTECSQLQLPKRLDQLDVPRPVLNSPEVCPGGVPGISAGIMLSDISCIKAPN